MRNLLGIFMGILVRLRLKSLCLSDFDPALGMMTGIPPINPLMPGLGIVPPPILSDMPVAKEIIHCKSCTLFPPNPSEPCVNACNRPGGLAGSLWH